ncbi:hypothetical protein ACP70R_046323 [Stipagrostis hirtigluma subsp. patula]
MVGPSSSPVRSSVAQAPRLRPPPWWARARHRCAPPSPKPPGCDPLHGGPELAVSRSSSSPAEISSAKLSPAEISSAKLPPIEIFGGKLSPAEILHARAPPSTSRPLCEIRGSELLFDAAAVRCPSSFRHPRPPSSFSPLRRHRASPLCAAAELRRRAPKSQNDKR